MGAGMTRVRIPAAVSYDPRGLVGVTTSKDRRFVNMLRQVAQNEVTGSLVLHAQKRSGLEQLYTSSSGRYGAAAHESQLGVIAAFADALMMGFGPTTGAGWTNLYIYQDGTLIETVTVPSGTGKHVHISETTISGTNIITVGIRVNGGYRGYYGTGAPLTQITDGNFPGGGVGPITHMNGHAFVMTLDGRVFNSDLNSISSWGASSFFATNQSPDGGRGCIRFGDYIHAFGTLTTELLQFANTSPSPLQRVPGATINIGCASVSSIYNAGTALYFLGRKQGASGDVGVYRFSSGGSIEKVSDENIDALIVGGGYVNSTIISGFTIGGVETITVQYAPNAMVCYVEGNPGYWFEWIGGGSILPSFGLVNGLTNTPICVSAGMDSGKTYRISPSAPIYTDDGNAYSAILQTGRLDFGSSNMKAIDSLAVVGDRQSASCPVTIEISDDDYVTFDAVGSVDMNTPHDRIAGLGAYERPALRLTNSSNTPFRIQGVDLNVTEFAH